ncbi:hypothetical protein A4H97_21905 [Niastella yeongjuensis]|uniref:Uncharacterized protein n=1 Tax=Niastella yeongjuensis TaxID=354355 RepID=A0A1V9F8M6_9BACT|nr:hypothetical protein [Niastella yeongjuensis]OQP54621.1 hypothetical protein A4H97_21905 [Niastella yeongjuensis]SEO01259.1 tRNA_anti-like [Niastella yeongjuensis]
MRNIVFTLGCGFVAFLAGVLVYLYNQPPRNLTTETGIPVTATELYTRFTTDHLHANEVYLNKVLQVSGQVLTIKSMPYAERIVVLNTGDPLNGIVCTLNKLQSAGRLVHPGEKIIIKGVCSGYVSHVMLTNSSLIQ